MITDRVSRTQAVVGLGLVICLFVAALAQTFLQHGWQPIAADMLNPIVHDIDAFVAQQLAEAAAAADQFSPRVLPLTTQGSDQPVDETEDFTQIERRLWAALLHNNQRRDHQSDRFIYADSHGRFIALREPSPGNFQFSRRTLREDPPAYRPSNARVIQLLPLPRSFDPRTRPWYVHAAIQGRSTWVPVYGDYETGVPRQSLATPLYRSDGTLQGVAAFDIDLAALTNKLRSALPNPDASAYLVNEQGQIIAKVGDDPIPSAFGMLWPSIIPPTRFAEAPSMQHSPVSLQSDGRTYWMVKQPIDGPADPNWHLIVTIPHSALVSLWWQQQGKRWALMVAALLLLPGLVFALVKRQLKQLDDLKAIVTLAVAEHPAQAISLQTDQQVKELKEKVSRRLRTDRLTGVLNRETFVAQVRSRYTNLSLFEPMSFSLLFVDLNGFKAVNDTYGHAAGDRVLKLAAGRMKQQLQRDDAIARFGGDEFVLYLHGTGDLAAVEALRDRLQSALAEPIPLPNGVMTTIGGAIGIVRYPHDGQDLDKLMALADERMYVAKRAMKQQDKPIHGHDIKASAEAMMEVVARQSHARTQPRKGRSQEAPNRPVRGVATDMPPPQLTKTSPDQIQVRWAGPTFSLSSRAIDPRFIAPEPSRANDPSPPPRYYIPAARTDHASSSPLHRG